MKILFFCSENIIAGNLAYIMKKEGHDVRLFIDDIERKANFDGMVEKMEDWDAGVEWVGKDGLIVFDDVGYGAMQDDLRRQGYSVFGGSAMADKLEFDRAYAQDVFEEHGLKKLETVNFTSLRECRDFLSSHPGSWVIKQNGHEAKDINYVSSFDDNRDILTVLDSYEKSYSGKVITLQKKVVGVEVGVGRYFNGDEWVGPIEMNFEYKKMFPSDLGPNTTEMGTIGWYDDNEKNKLFLEVLAPLKPYLQEIRFKGDFEINCMVNEGGAYPLEASPRFGSPIIYLHCELHESPWGEFLKAIADGKNYDLKWKRGSGIVLLLATPPFPYAKKMSHLTSCGNGIFFKKELTKEDLSHIHFEGVSLSDDQYFVSDDVGYVLYVTAVGEDIANAQKKAYTMIADIVVPKGFYRDDIGDRVLMDDIPKLQSLEYL